MEQGKHQELDLKKFVSGSILIIESYGYSVDLVGEKVEIKNLKNNEVTNIDGATGLLRFFNDLLAEFSEQ